MDERRSWGHRSSSRFRDTSKTNRTLNKWTKTTSILPTSSLSAGDYPTDQYQTPAQTSRPQCNQREWSQAPRTKTLSFKLQIESKARSLRWTARTCGRLGQILASSNRSWCRVRVAGQVLTLSLCRCRTSLKFLEPIKAIRFSVFHSRPCGSPPRPRMAHRNHCCRGGGALTPYSRTSFSVGRRLRLRIGSQSVIQAICKTLAIKMNLWLSAGARLSTPRGRQ